MNTIDQDNNFHISQPPDVLGPLWYSVGRTASGCSGVLIAPDTVYFSPFTNVSVGETIQFPDGSTHSVVLVYVSTTTGATVAKLSTPSALTFAARFIGDLISANEVLIICSGLGIGKYFNIGWRFGGPETVVKRWHSTTPTIEAVVDDQFLKRVFQTIPAGITFNDLTFGAYVWMDFAGSWRFVGHILNTAILADYLRSRYPIPLIISLVDQDKSFLDSIISDTIKPQPSEAIFIRSPARNTQINAPDTLVTGSFTIPGSEVYIHNATTDALTKATVVGNNFMISMQLNFGINVLQAHLINPSEPRSLPHYVFRTENQWPDPPEPRGPMTVDINGDMIWKGKLYRLNKHLTV